MNEASSISARIQVLRVVALALGIGQKEYAENRMLLKRCGEGRTRSFQKLQKVEEGLNRAVFSRFRSEGLAGRGGANDFADRMLTLTLRFYPRMCAELGEGTLIRPARMSLFVTDVLVPTAFALMCSAHDDRDEGGLLALGNEFAGARSWYTPDDGKVFHALLDRWLRVMGYRTPCGFSRDSVSLVGEVKRWWNGSSFPTIDRLDWIATRDAYAERVAWLDNKHAWKARLRLARALQSLSDKAASYFKEHRLQAPDILHLQFKALEKESEAVVVDPDGWLCSPEIFWAVRLVQRQLKRTKHWDDVTQLPRNQIARHFSASASHARVEAQQRADERRLSAGYQLLRHLAREGNIPLRCDLSRVNLAVRQRFEDYVLSLGFAELRQLADKARPALKAGRAS